MLKESLEHEQAALDAYYDLLKLVEGGKDVLLEEYARALIVEEETHLDEVNKMLRKPGELEPFNPSETYGRACSPSAPHASQGFLILQADGCRVSRVPRQRGHAKVSHPYLKDSEVIVCSMGILPMIPVH